MQDNVMPHVSIEGDPSRTGYISVENMDGLRSFG